MLIYSTNTRKCPILRWIFFHPTFIPPYRGMLWSFFHGLCFQFCLLAIDIRPVTMSKGGSRTVHILKLVYMLVLGYCCLVIFIALRYVPFHGRIVAFVVLTSCHYLFYLNSFFSATYSSLNNQIRCVVSVPFCINLLDIVKLRQHISLARALYIY